MNKELLQLLVETEDKMERLAILEEHPELMEETTAPDGEAGPTEDYKAKYEELEAKYIARFFGKGEEEPKEEEKSNKKLSIDDLKL